MDIIDLAKKFGSNIQKTKEYAKLLEAKKNNDLDIELENMISEFNLLKLKSQKNSKNDPEIDKQINDIYDKIMQNKNMIKFNEASDEMDRLMNKINKILIAAVNGHDPITYNVDDASSCNNSCGSCRNCSSCQ